MKKTLTMFLAIVMMLSICSFVTAEEAPTKVSIMIPLYYSEAPTATNELELQMEEYTNTDITFLWTPIDNYSEKINLAIASADMPNAMGVLDIKASMFVEAARADMFWDITEMIKDYPNLYEHYKAQMLTNASIDGKLYGLPRARPLTRDGVIYRKDWAQNLGLNIEQPITLDGLYEIIKAFATQDPDGNGKDDTYGLLLGVNADGSLAGYVDRILDVANGGYCEWGINAEGNVESAYLTEAHLKTLKWLKRLYDENLMNKDFATVLNTQFYELLDKEVGGLYIQTLTDAHERLDTLVANVKARMPELQDKTAIEAKVDIIDTIYQIATSDGELRAHTQNGFNGMFVFPKSSNPTEADVRKVLQFFDTMDSPDGQSIIYWGKQGVHWDYVDGVATMTSDSLLFSREVQPYWQLFLTNRETDRCSIKGYVAPMYTKVYAEMESNLPYAVYNVSVPLLSDTYTENSTYLNKIIHDAEIQFIMGMIDEDGWWDAVARWREAGGDKVAEEYTIQYNEMNK